MLIVYVDDIILTENLSEETVQLKQLLSKEFEIKGLGHLRYFLGMEVARYNKSIYITQRKYTLDILRESGMSGCKPIETPMDANTKLKANLKDEAVD